MACLALCDDAAPLWQPGLTEDDKLSDELLADAVDMGSVGTKFTKDDVRFPNTSRAQVCWYVARRAAPRAVVPVPRWQMPRSCEACIQGRTRGAVRSVWRRYWRWLPLLADVTRGVSGALAKNRHLASCFFSLLRSRVLCLGCPWRWSLFIAQIVVAFVVSFH